MWWEMRRQAERGRGNESSLCYREQGIWGWRGGRGGWREERAVIKGERQGKLGGEETGGDMYTRTHTLRERAEAARERNGGVQTCLP